MTGRHPYTFYISGRQPFDMTGACTVYTMDIDVSTFIPYTLPFCSVPPFTEPTFVPREPEPVSPDLALPDLCQCITHDVTINRVFGVLADDATFDIRVTRTDDGDCCDQQFLLDVDLKIPCTPFELNCNASIDNGIITGWFTHSSTCEIDLNLYISLPAITGITVEIGSVFISVGAPVDFVPEIDFDGYKRKFNYHIRFPSCPSCPTCPSCCIVPGTWLTWHTSDLNCTIDHISAFNGSVWLGYPPYALPTWGVLEGRYYGRKAVEDFNQIQYPTYHKYMRSLEVRKYGFDYNFGHLLSETSVMVTHEVDIHFMECNDINVTCNVVMHAPTQAPYVALDYRQDGFLPHGTCNYRISMDIGFPPVACAGTWLTLDGGGCIAHDDDGETATESIFGIKINGLQVSFYRYDIVLNFGHVMDISENDLGAGGYLCDETCFTCADYRLTVNKDVVGCGDFDVVASNLGAQGGNRCVFKFSFHVSFPEISDLTAHDGILRVSHDGGDPCLHHIRHLCEYLTSPAVVLEYDDIDPSPAVPTGVLAFNAYKRQFQYTCGHLEVYNELGGTAYQRTFWHPDMLVGDESGLISVLDLGGAQRRVRHNRYLSTSVTLLDVNGLAKALVFQYGHLVDVIQY